MKIITSIHNEQLKTLAKLLQSAKHRREQGATVLEGVHLLEAYLTMGHVPVQVFVPDTRLAHHEVADLLCRLPESCITLVQQGALHKISQLTDAEDVMTWIPLPNQAILPHVGDCVVLEQVQDVGNLGTILRSAAAAGVREVVLSKGCADVWQPKVLRAGMGAHFLLNIHERIDLLAWRQAYHGRVWATALSEQRHHTLYDRSLDLREPSAWIFGNEGRGVSPELLAQADASIRIPMLGKTESLNVAMAATICLFEQMRQRLTA